MAADIVFNAKTSRPSVCNACESVLVHKAVAEEAIVAVAGRLKEKNVEIFGDEIVCSVLDLQSLLQKRTGEKNISITRSA